jgi:hypothetical protein
MKNETCHQLTRKDTTTMLNIQFPNFIMNNLVYTDTITSQFKFVIVPFRLKINEHTPYNRSKAQIMSYDDPLHSQK